MVDRLRLRPRTRLVRCARLAVSLGLTLFACVEGPPARNEPEWRRLDGSPGDAAALRRDHGACTAEHGRPDLQDGTEMARWTQDFGDCMGARGWRLAPPNR